MKKVVLIFLHQKGLGLVVIGKYHPKLLMLFNLAFLMKCKYMSLIVFQIVMIDHHSFMWCSNTKYYQVNITKCNVHLGLNFQSDARWNLPIQGTYEKACSRLNVLRMLKRSLCRDALVKIYMSFIRPVLEYVDIVWDN